MTELQRLADFANRLAQEEADPIPAIPFHARNGLHYHERAYYLCSCGKGFTDISSKRTHQQWCQTHCSRESERLLSLTRCPGS
jgi:hypothetical protein